MTSRAKNDPIRVSDGSDGVDKRKRSTVGQMVDRKSVQGGVSWKEN